MAHRTAGRYYGTGQDGRRRRCRAEPIDSVHRRRSVWGRAVPRRPPWLSVPLLHASSSMLARGRLSMACRLPRAVDGSDALLDAPMDPPSLLKLPGTTPKKQFGHHMNPSFPHPIPLCSLSHPSIHPLLSFFLFSVLRCFVVLPSTLASSSPTDFTCRSASHISAPRPPWSISPPFFFCCCPLLSLIDRRPLLGPAPRFPTSGPSDTASPIFLPSKPVSSSLNIPDDSFSLQLVTSADNTT